MLQLIRGIVLLLSLVVAVCDLGNCEEYSAVFDSDGRHQCAVGQPNEVHLSTTMGSFECARLCDENQNCVAFSVYDNIKCEIFTCLSSYTRFYQKVPLCKSFHVNDCLLKCNQSNCGFSPAPRDCADVSAAGMTESGVYVINVGNSNDQSSVYCNLSSSGSWLIIQRRKDGSVDFNRTWTEYANGFGDLTGEFWIGNELLHRLTANRKYRIRIDLENVDGMQTYAEYPTFAVASSSDFYKLSIGPYTGNAGDGLAIHNGKMFSTWEADHGTDTKDCAQVYCCGWWHTTCLAIYSVLNGVHPNVTEESCGTKMDWWNCLGTNCHALVKIEMKIGA